MQFIDNGQKAGQFFTALLTEYSIRLETLDKSRARATGMLPLFGLAALAFSMWVYYYVTAAGHVTASAILAFVAMAVFFAGAAFLIIAASHKGLVRADVNKLLKAAELSDPAAATATADIYIDRINDLDRMVERQEGNARSGSWLMYSFMLLATISVILMIAGT